MGLADQFQSLPADYQNVIRSAQHQHGISVVPFQELKGGFTGAVLYLVSVSEVGKIEHLVLKLDRLEAGQPDELDRHKRAHEQAPPDFAREHMAEVAFDRVELDGSIAIFNESQARVYMAFVRLLLFSSRVTWKPFSAC